MDDRVTRVKDILGLRRLPIKIGFLGAPPAALARWAGGPVAAGCVFWDRAMEGKSFYTLPADHWNCAIGSHTHKIGLPADRANELSDTIGFMVETRYLDPAEVPDIPTLDQSPAAVREAAHQRVQDRLEARCNQVGPADGEACRTERIEVCAVPVFGGEAAVGVFGVSQSVARGVPFAGRAITRNSRAGS